MSDDLDYSGSGAPPPVPSTGQSPQRGSSNGVIGWIIVAVVVLVLAVAGGLLTAFVVANMRAVPGPIAGASPTTSPAVASSCACSPTPGMSAPSSDAPRRTPTPLATVAVTQAPFVHVVQKGESLTYIAALYQVDAQDIIDLNEIKNPNRIQVGQELLIPGYGVQPTPKPAKTPK